MANRRQCKPNREPSIRLLSCRLVSNIAYRVVICLELLLCFPLSSIFCPCATKKSSCTIRPPRNQCQTACNVTVETNKEIDEDESTEVVGKKRIKAKAASATSSKIIRDDKKIVLRSESTIVQYQTRDRRDDDCDEDGNYEDDMQYRPRGRQYYDAQGYPDDGCPEPREKKPKPKRQRPNPNYDPTCVDNTRLAFGYDNIPPHNRDTYDADCPRPRNYESNYQDDTEYRSQNYEQEFDRNDGYDDEGPDPCEKSFDPYTPENVKIKYGPDRMKYVDRNRNMLFDDPNRGSALQTNKTPMVRCKLSLSRTQRLSRSQRWLPGLGKLNLQQIGFPENWFGNSRIKDAYDSAKVKTKNPFKNIK